MDNQEMAQVIEVIRQQSEAIMDHVDRRLTQSEAKMEFKIQQQIDALFDGFKMMQENHQVHEERISKIEAHGETTDIRLLSLENKGA